MFSMFSNTSEDKVKGRIFCWGPCKKNVGIKITGGIYDCFEKKFLSSFSNDSRFGIKMASNLTNLSIKSHSDPCEPCKESIPGTQNFKVLKTCCSQIETKLIKALLIKCLKPIFNVGLHIKLGRFALSKNKFTRLSLEFW